MCATAKLDQLGYRVQYVQYVAQMEFARVDKELKALLTSVITGDPTLSLSGIDYRSLYHPILKHNY